jgi:DNA primase
MEISDIKTRLSILTLMDRYNIPLDKHHKACCPFHEEKTPSFTVYPKTNTFHCFGCGKSGDTIEFIQLKENITKHQAILKAQDFIGVPSIMEPPPNPQPEKPVPPEERTAILTKIFELFKNGLNHPVSVKPKEYIKKRNLNPAMLEMGYNSGQFHHHGKLSEIDQQACINAGLLVPYKGSVPYASGTTYTAFAKDCIIFPLKDKQDQIISLYGRSITSNDKSKHYYLKDRQGLYPNYPNPATTKLILTEAIIDASSLLSNPEIISKYSVLACYGTNGLTDEHKQAIAGLKQLKEIIFFFDGDKSGKEAITKHSEILHQLRPGIKLTYIETPENEDINSLAQGHEPEIFTHLLDHRKPFLLSFENKTYGQGNIFLCR